MNPAEADYNVPAASPTLGLTQLQPEVVLTATRDSTGDADFALVCLLGLLGVWIFEAHRSRPRRHRRGARRSCAQGPRKCGKNVLVPLPPAVARAVDRAAGHRTFGPLLRNRRGARMDRHAATRRLHHLAAAAVVQMPRLHRHMLGHTFVTTMSTGVDLRRPDRGPSRRPADHDAV